MWPYITGVDIELLVLLLIALVVGVDMLRSFDSRKPRIRDPLASTGKIIVDLDRRS
jgi:hypothetical protein